MATMLTAKEKRIMLLQKMVAFSGLIVLFIWFSFTANRFFSINNILTVALQTSSIAFMGIGVTYVIITAGIDLSIGSVVALCGVVAGMSVKAGTPIWLGMLFAVVVGIICGIINGFFVTAFNLPPFIATLGMMLIARGVALQLTEAKAIAGMPEEFGILGNGTLFKITETLSDGKIVTKFPGIPFPVIIMILVALLFAFILKKTKIGLYIYAVGSNEEATRLSGINVKFVKIFALAVSGGLAGLTGIVIMSRLVTAQPNAGVAYELDAIATAVIGGTSLMGGVGTISGTLIGAFIIGILRNGLNMQGVSYFIQQIIIGSVIIVAVAVDQIRNRKKL